ncbi:hypothetical protein WJX73_004344 [Symbiochloris irregularis]|uniref:ATP synthase mitochondrial F1 complex assembly factor 2 n=1 Tax=Symbiochloris irregularis TaxID=706552 RepID=A0AAW1P655_9CHLO
MILRYWPSGVWASKLKAWQGLPCKRHSASAGQRSKARPACMSGSALSADSSLWEKVLQSYQRAQQKGAAYQTETSTQVLSDAGIGFVIRRAAALKDKPGGQKSRASTGGKPANPFLPYDEDLWVSHLSETHTLLLNKFNVVPHHLLVVTRQFEPQLDHLTLADLEATCQVLQAFPSGALAFFNRGEVSALHQLPFKSWFSHLSAGASGAEAHAAYEALLQASGLHSAPRDASYNLWLAEGLMLLALRSREACGPVAANTLGFAGTMLVKSDEQLQYLKDHGPMHVLESIGKAWD